MRPASTVSALSATASRYPNRKLLHDQPAMSGHQAPGEPARHAACVLTDRRWARQSPWQDVAVEHGCVCMPDQYKGGMAPLPSCMRHWQCTATHCRLRAHALTQLKGTARGVVATFRWPHLGSRNTRTVASVWARVVSKQACEAHYVFGL